MFSLYPIQAGRAWLLRRYQVTLKPSDLNFKWWAHRSGIAECKESYHSGPHFKLLNYLTSYNIWISFWFCTYDWNTVVSPCLHSEVREEFYALTTLFYQPSSITLPLSSCNNLHHIRVLYILLQFSITLLSNINF